MNRLKAKGELSSGVVEGSNNQGKTHHNAASLCSGHHALVHKGGYTIQCVEDDDRRLHEQLVQQQHTADISQFDVEKELRNDKESFNTVRTLSPECCRFRRI